MIPNKLNPIGYDKPPLPLKNPTNGEDVMRQSGTGTQIRIIPEDGWYKCIARGAAGSSGDGAGGAGGGINVRLYLRKEWGLWACASTAAANGGAGGKLAQKYGTGNGGAGNSDYGSTSGTKSTLGGGGAGGAYGRSGGGGGGAIGNGGPKAYRGGDGGGGGAIVIYDRTKDLYGWGTSEPYYYTEVRNPAVGGQIFDGNHKPIKGMTVGATTTSGNYVSAIRILKDGVLQSSISVNDSAPDYYAGWLYQEMWKYLILASGGGGGPGNENNNRRGGAGGGAGTNGGKNTGTGGGAGAGGYTGIKSYDLSATAKNGTDTGGAYAAGRAGVGNAFDVRTPEKPVLIKDVIDRNTHNSTTGTVVVIKQVEA